MLDDLMLVLYRRPYTFFRPWGALCSNILGIADLIMSKSQTQPLRESMGMEIVFSDDLVTGPMTKWILQTQCHWVVELNALNAMDFVQEELLKGEVDTQKAMLVLENVEIALQPTVPAYFHHRNWNLRHYFGKQTRIETTFQAVDMMQSKYPTALGGIEWDALGHGAYYWDALPQWNEFLVRTGRAGCVWYPEQGRCPGLLPYGSDNDQPQQRGMPGSYVE